MAKVTEAADAARQDPNELVDYALPRKVTETAGAAREDPNELVDYALPRKVTETAGAAREDPNELVDYILPRKGPRDRDVFVGVNGETIRIKRGQPVKIKRKFAEVLDHAIAQEEAAWQAQVEAQKASSRALADL